MTTDSTFPPLQKAVKLSTSLICNRPAKEIRIYLNDLINSINKQFSVSIPKRRASFSAKVAKFSNMVNGQNLPVRAPSQTPTTPKTPITPITPTTPRTLNYKSSPTTPTTPRTLNYKSSPTTPTTPRTLYYKSSPTTPTTPRTLNYKSSPTTPTTPRTLNYKSPYAISNNNSVNNNVSDKSNNQPYYWPTLYIITKVCLMDLEYWEKGAGHPENRTSDSFYSQPKISSMFQEVKPMNQRKIIEEILTDLGKIQEVIFRKITRPLKT